jgi:hypothetical protein
MEKNSITTNPCILKLESILYGNIGENKVREKTAHAFFFKENVSKISFIRIISQLTKYQVRAT